MSSTNNREQLARDLYRLLQANPTGMYRDSIMTSLRIGSVNEFHVIKGMLQETLSVAHTETLVGERSNGGDGWWYSLESESNAAARAYLIEKDVNSLGRDIRAYQCAISLARDADQATAEGRAARRRLRAAYRLLQDRVDMLAEMGVDTSTLPALPVAPN